MIKSCRQKEINLIGIVGVGLIGGSLGLALQATGDGYQILGIGRDISRLKKAHQMGVITEYSCNYEALNNADIIFMCQPVSIIIKETPQCLPYLKKGAIVTDVGSTKSEIVHILTPLLANGGVSFVGGHPLAGSEQSGVENAHSELFKKKVCVLTPTIETDYNALDVINSLWREIGADILLIDPSKHDQLIAFTSHLPHIVASVLVNVVAKAVPEIRPFIASGFRDTTRIASSSPIQWRDICISNKDMILNALSIFKDILDDWEEIISSYPDKLLEHFEQTKSWRDNI